MEGIINIAGVMPRIGTTTVAMQLIQFLRRMNYVAAYIERNPQDYLWGVENMYAEAKSDKSTGMVSCAGIDMFPEKALEQLTAGGARYDYLICDFGNVLSNTFDYKRFSECSAMIIVAGVKANEVYNTENVMRRQETENAIYVFNFIRPEDENDILEMMGDKAPATAFAPWMPDPLEPAGEAADDCFMTVMNNVVMLLGG